MKAYHMPTLIELRLRNHKALVISILTWSDFCEDYPNMRF